MANFDESIELGNSMLLAVVVVVPSDDFSTLFRTTPSQM